MTLIPDSDQRPYHVLWIDDNQSFEVLAPVTVECADSTSTDHRRSGLGLVGRFAIFFERFVTWLYYAIVQNPVKTRLVLTAALLSFATVKLTGTAHALGILDTINTDLQSHGNGFFTGSFGVADSIFGVVATIAIMTSLASYVAEYKTFAGSGRMLLNVILMIAIPWGILKFAETVLPQWYNVALNLGNTITGESIKPSPDAIFVTGAGLAGEMLKSVATKMLDHAQHQGVNVGGALVDVLTAVVAIVGAVILLITFALLAVEMLVAFCQGYIALSVGAFQLGWSASSATSSFATAYWGLLSSAITRIIVTMAIIGIGLTEAQKWITQIHDLNTLDPNLPSANIMALLQIPLMGLVLLFLTIKVTEIAAAQLTGRPVYSAGAAGAVAAGGAVGGVAGGLGGGMAGGAAGAVRGAMQGAASGGSVESAVAGAMRGGADGGLRGAMGGAARGAAAGRSAGNSVKRN